MGLSVLNDFLLPRDTNIPSEQSFLIGCNPAPIEKDCRGIQWRRYGTIPS